MSSENPTTRERILQSALRLLEEEGGNAVRMSDIAKAAKISRQALYLHFPNRAELLVATTHYVDELHDIESQLVASRTASSGRERLDAWVEVWGNHIPVIYGVGKALMAMKDTDPEAALAWDERMQAVRHGAAAAVAALATDGDLANGLSQQDATDLLWTLQSVRNWEQLRLECGWSQERYIAGMKRMANDVLLRPGAINP